MKNEIKFIFVLLLITTFGFTQYKIPQSVIGNGGAVTANSSHRINGTVGQNVIGDASGSPFSSVAGFWYMPGRIITDVEQITNMLPTEYRLYQNYPNPFNPVTVISYQLPGIVGQDGILTYKVTLKIYNLLGQEVAELVNEEKQSGIYSVNWNASGFASGVYFYRINVGQIGSGGVNFTNSKKLLIMK